METSASCEEPMKEEVADSSKQGMQISSLLDTSLSDANTLSLSGVPVEMETSASKNNDLENVLMRDQPVKKKVKKRKRKRPDTSCEETMEVEVTDASKLGTPICSVVETSISNPNFVSVSGVPVDLKLSTSNNNDLENVLMDGHSLKKKAKKNKKKRSKSATIEEPLEGDVADSSKQVMPINSLVETSLSIPNIVSVTGVPVDKINASKNNHLENVPVCDNPVKQQALPSSLKGVAPICRRKLLVLDVNGILVDIVVGYSHRYKPDTRVATKAVFKRPFCDEFLQFCFERFDVGIWSSRTRQNLKKVVDFLLEDSKDRLRFCWDQSHCTATEYKTLENSDKPLVLKELKYLWWDTKGSHLPWNAGYYNETNTVLLDDSPYKALRNPVTSDTILILFTFFGTSVVQPNTAIFPRPYSYKNAGDYSLGPGGDLRKYLERLAEAENVQKFIQENPFGQRPISIASRSWNFYSKIVGNYGRQEENSNIAPGS
uniref:Mitochondrial import inner membrane translocase subunit TIM50 n=1 Tax=Chenopodium quinoa TaxID=63459 RepID=A0A803M0Q5_CHEQI